MLRRDPGAGRARTHPRSAGGDDHAAALAEDRWRVQDLRALRAVARRLVGSDARTRVQRAQLRVLHQLVVVSRLADAPLLPATPRLRGQRLRNEPWQGG